MTLHRPHCDCPRWLLCVVQTCGADCQAPRDKPWTPRANHSPRPHRRRKVGTLDESVRQNWPEGIPPWARVKS